MSKEKAPRLQWRPDVEAPPARLPDDERFHVQAKVGPSARMQAWCNRKPGICQDVSTLYDAAWRMGGDAAVRSLQVEQNGTPHVNCAGRCPRCQGTARDVLGDPASNLCSLCFGARVLRRALTMLDQANVEPGGGDA